jgi:ankyrin repeat protein
MRTSSAATETEVLLDAAPGQLRGSDRYQKPLSPVWWASWQVPSSHSHVAGASQSSGIQLREAAARGDINCCERLLREGADINGAPGMMGMTALHAACERGHTAVVNMLLLRGAEPSSTTASGETALDRATYQGHAGCVRAMLSHGADPKRVAASTGWSPVSMADSLQHHSAARYLHSGAAQAPATRSSSRGSTALLASPSHRGLRTAGLGHPPASPSMELRQKLQFSPPARNSATLYSASKQLSLTSQRK